MSDRTCPEALRGCRGIIVGVTISAVCFAVK
jgi:hypothetical protein